ncbi:hypothetical protein ACH4S8_34275 [Streptomyces sp. NPDC021080]|uniref:hypothetical protein n=1 Tax=Streptomyces sp. NPDC021080 TaxID=3365110 RepID=UPI0037958729
MMPPQRSRQSRRPSLVGRSSTHLDGLTVTLGDGRWFNLRPSNIDPVVRLTAEGPTDETMNELRDEVLALLRDVKE